MGLRETVEHAAIRLGVYRQARKAYRWTHHRQTFVHNRAEDQFYSQFIGRGDLVFDIGANVGERSRIFLDLGARVVAVEPNPSCADVIRARYSCRSLAVESVAVGAQQGSGRLHVADRDTLSSMFEDWAPSGTLSRTIEVPVTTVDDLIIKHGIPDFVKIDVEGFEAEVLSGMSRSVPYLSFEFHLLALAEARRCVEMLTSPERRFNFSWDESMTLALPSWADAKGLMTAFERLLSASDGSRYGDVYVRDDLLVAARHG